jgi:hypothetical protein
MSDPIDGSSVVEGDAGELDMSYWTPWLMLSYHFRADRDSTRYRCVEDVDENARVLGPRQDFRGVVELKNVRGTEPGFLDRSIHVGCG